MKIRSVRPVLLNQAYREEERWRFPGGSASGWNCALLVLETDDGLTGLGEAIAGSTAPVAYSGAVAQLRPFLEGRDVDDVPGLLSEMRRAGPYWCNDGMGGGVLSAVEIALLDLMGKAAGKPVWQLLGTARRESLPAYISGGFMKGDAELAVEMALWRQAGWQAMKIRAFGHPGEAIRTVGVARAALGDGPRLMVDFAANFVKEPWNSRQAIEALRGMEEFNLEFAEEILPTASVADLVVVNRETAQCIAAGENLGNRAALDNLILTGAVGLVQPDPTHCGGLRSVLSIAEFAATHGVAIAPHHWGSGVSLAASLHLGALLPSETWIEVCGVANAFQSALLIDGLHLQEGRISVPQGPGLGVHLPADFRQRYESKDLASGFY
jgi:D-galactarolactone cycloisomerase